MSRPWMPLYIADYLADTSHLNCAESGAYLHLIMHYWQKGGLPSEDKRLASIARATPEQWADMRSAIAEFFGDDWTHARIDEELKSAAKAYERRAAAGRAGGKAKAESKQSYSIAKAGLKQSQPQPQLEDEVANATSSPEPEKSAPVAVVGLPTVSEGDFPIFEADVAEWQPAYPGVDVVQQLASMRQWLIANPTRRKTRKGMKRFVVTWLDRRQNAGGSAPVPRATAPPAPSGNAVGAINAALDNLISGQPDEPDKRFGRTIDASFERRDRGGTEDPFQRAAFPARH